MKAVTELSRRTSTRAACAAFGVPWTISYRRAKTAAAEAAERPTSPFALSEAEEQRVLDALYEPGFRDFAPYYIYATLVDEAVYHCSTRTMYRVLAKHDEVRERRRQVSRPHYQKPELLVTGPKQVWTWDITKLKGPAKWTFFLFYVICDIYSRYVVGWMIAHRKSANIAKRLLKDTCEKQRIEPEQQAIHADLGSSMISKAIAFLLTDLRIAKTKSRPHNSNDTPYSESQFKTLKYYRELPASFGCTKDARSFCCDFTGGTTMHTSTRR